MTNLHITLTPFRNESRLLKETASLVRHGVVDRALVVALHEEGLSEHEEIDKERSVWRVRLRSRALPRHFVTQIVTYFELFCKLLLFTRGKSIRLINVHTLDLLPIGVALKILLRGQLIYDAHELETEVEGLTGKRQKIARFIERRFISKADLTILVSESITNLYQEMYPGIPVVTVLNCPERRQVEPSRTLRDEFGIADEAKVFLYLGGLGAGRGIEAMIGAFASANPAERVLVVMGYGELAGFVIEKAATSRAIFFKNAVPPSQVLDVAASADVGIVFIEDTSLSYRYSLPNKLFEYLMAGLPVIASNLPEIARILKKTRAGIVVPEFSVAGLVDGIERYMRLDHHEIAANARAAAQVYSWENQEREMLAAYDKYIKRSTP